MSILIITDGMLTNSIFKTAANDVDEILLSIIYHNRLIILIFIDSAGKVEMFDILVLFKPRLNLFGIVYVEYDRLLVAICTYILDHNFRYRRCTYCKNTNSDGNSRITTRRLPCFIAGSKQSGL